MLFYKYFYLITKILFRFVIDSRMLLKILKTVLIVVHASKIKLGVKQRMNFKAKLQS